MRTIVAKEINEQTEKAKEEAGKGKKGNNGFKDLGGSGVKRPPLTNDSILD